MRNKAFFILAAFIAIILYSSGAGAIDWGRRRDREPPRPPPPPNVPTIPPRPPSPELPAHAPEDYETRTRTAVLTKDDHMGFQTSIFHGRRFDFAFSREAFEAAPKWTENMENPPLSAMRALNAAQDAVRRLLPDSGQWKLLHATLTPLEDYSHWYWKVSFTGPPASGMVGAAPIIDIPVLFDGRVPSARVSNL